jgi:IS605 OrfB family transposase
VEKIKPPKVALSILGGQESNPAPTDYIANRRKDFLHKTSANLVKQYGLIATEELSVRNMTAHGGEYKKGLNRSILDAAPSIFLNLLKTKAEEAGSLWMEVPTRQVKPSQTCHRCGVRRKKPLSERTHYCGCGASCSRDENAARVMRTFVHLLYSFSASPEVRALQTPFFACDLDQFFRYFVQFHFSTPSC